MTDTLRSSEKRYTCLQTVGPDQRGCGLVFASWDELKEHEKTHAQLTSNPETDLAEALEILAIALPGPRPWPTEGVEAKLRIYRNMALDRRRSPPETNARRCGWFGEGRGQCLLDEGHEAHLQTRHHTCEQDGRMLDVALTGLAAVREAERRSEKANEEQS